jgi:molybdopterin converting factor small subunit
LAADHPLVRLTDTLDWTALVAQAEAIRRTKLKSRAGRPPHLRALVGVVVLMGLRRMPLREAEDQVRYYAPARYLCGLTETEWTPDFTTIQDFEALMGEQGLEQLNGAVVDLAVELGLCDPRVAVADTTCQEAAIPHPNEMGLMGGFLRSMTKAAGRVGGAVGQWLKRVGSVLKAAQHKIREYRLLAKTKEVKNRVQREMVELVEGVTAGLGQVLEATRQQGGQLRGHAVGARRKLEQLGETMGRLLPQIRYWLRTGRVAAGKIISVHIPQLYAVVRGKVGKAVEFGVVWGSTRLGGGFVLAKRAKDKRDLVDSRFAVQAVEDLIERYGVVPRAYAYDRGGWSEGNVKRLKELGVKEVGLAPRGRAAWAVGGRARQRLIRERAMVEGSIGTAKSPRYGFNRPARHSTEMMGVSGQRAVLGANLTKLLRGVEKWEAAAGAA